MSVSQNDVDKNSNSRGGKITRISRLILSFSIRALNLLKSSVSIYGFELFLFFSSCMLYANTLRGAYVWDDRAAILGNGDVTQTNNLSSLFIHDFWGQNLHDTWSHKSYRPLTTLSFRANHAVHGLSAMGFHLVNVLIYAIGVVFTYWVFKRWLSCEVVARVAAMLYCYHPVHVEAVASLVGRADSLCGLFFMASLLAYSKSMQTWSKLDASCNIENKKKSVIYFLCSIFLAFAASLAKEIGVTILGMLVVAEVANTILISLPLKQKCHFDEKNAKISPSNVVCQTFNDGLSICLSGLKKAVMIPFSASQVRISLVVITLVLMSVLRIYINGPQSLYQWSHLENHIAHLPTFLERTFSYAQTHFWYLMKLFYPRHLCFDYGYACIPTIHSFWDLRNIFSLAAYTWVLYTLRVAIMHVNVHLLFGLAMLLIPLIPALNILFPVGTTLAERLLFVPSAGFCMIAGEALYYFFAFTSTTEPKGEIAKEITALSSYTKSKHFKLYSFTLLICLVFGVRIITRNRDWNSESQIYESALRVCPLSAKALTNYAVLHMDSGNVHNAAAAAISSVEIFDDQSPAWLNAGVVQQRLGYFARGAYYYEKSLLKSRASSKMWGYLGATYYEWSLKSNEDQNCIAGGVEELRKRASSSMDTAIASGFSPPSTLHSRGSLALDMNDPNKAIEFLQKALELTAISKSINTDVPQSDLVNEAYTLNQLGNVYSRIGRHNEAISVYMRGLNLDGTALSLLVNVGSSLRAVDRLDEARSVLLQAISIQEKNSGEPSIAVLNNLALVEMDDGNFDTAEQLLYRADSLHKKQHASKGSLIDNDGEATHIRASEIGEESIEKLIETNLHRVQVERERFQSKNFK
jgi:protein O-mannosyl-transferase